MKKLKTPRDIPDKPRYFSIEVEGKGLHHFKTPMPLYCAQLTTEMDKIGFARYSKMSKEDAEEAKVELAKQLDWGGLIELWKMAGAAFGLSWFHKELELETERKRYGKDLGDYGEAVLDELYEEGYDLRILAPVFVELMGHLAQAIIGSQEVKERADFSVVPKVSSN